MRLHDLCADGEPESVAGDVLRGAEESLEDARAIGLGDADPGVAHLDDTRTVLGTNGEFDRATLIVWIKSYCRRFFTQQYKRSTSADGPAVMGFTLSPRDGHKMPSDAENALWLGQADRL